MEDRMSLKLESSLTIPKETSRVAKAVFPNGNVYITLRDKMGSIFVDNDFVDLFPKRGQPAIPPWRLALITILQFGENLSDRQAANAVRARIDWKYLLGLELEDSGFDFSILSEFRGRLLSSGAEERLLSNLLEYCKKEGLVRNKGTQRTDSTRVLACVRNLARIELVAETMRAALNEIASLEPKWLLKITPKEWYDKYSRKIEKMRLPEKEDQKEKYAVNVGKDGFHVLDSLKNHDAPKSLLGLSKIKALNIVWNRHYKRNNEGGIIFKNKTELIGEEEKIESPYDMDARFRKKRETAWVGYMVHLTETCNNDNINIITNVKTTPADEHDVRSTQIIQKELSQKNIAPKKHLVDSAYVSLDLLIRSKDEYGIDIVGPARIAPGWREKIKEAYSVDMFNIDWDNEEITCPEGKKASSWRNKDDYITAVFSVKDCRNCLNKKFCIRGKNYKRKVCFPVKEQYNARVALRKRLRSEEGKILYRKRAGIEGTISQGVRLCGMRKSRYIGLKKKSFAKYL